MINIEYKYNFSRINSFLTTHTKLFNVKLLSEIFFIKCNSDYKSCWDLVTSKNTTANLLEQC